MRKTGTMRSRLDASNDASQRPMRSWLSLRRKVGKAVGEPHRDTTRRTEEDNAEGRGRGRGRTGKTVRLDESTHARKLRISFSLPRPLCAYRSLSVLEARE